MPMEDYMRLLLISTLSVSSLLAEALAPSCPNFGTLAAATFGGSGIPNTSVCHTTFTDGAATITIGLTATPRFTGVVTDNGAGTYAATAGTGFPSPLGLWNFNYYVSITGNTGGNSYGFDLLYDTDPSMNAVGTLGHFTALLTGPTILLQDSVNLGFGVINGGGFPGQSLPSPNTLYNADAAGLYTFALQVTNLAPGGATGGVSIQVQADAPEPGTYALVGLGLAAVVARSRRRAVN